MKKLFKGSENPPLDKPILLKNIHGCWGIGSAYKWHKNVYFNYHGVEHTWLGSPKCDFVGWMEFPTE